MSGLTITPEDAYSAFIRCVGPDYMLGVDTMLRGGMTAETFCSYGIADLPENVYDVFLLAIQHAEETVKERECLECSYLNGKTYKFCSKCSQRINEFQTRNQIGARP